MADPAPKDADIATTRIVVSGFVQGVGYRRWLQDEAHELQLTGWVRNRTDGNVEAVVHGPAAKIEDLIRACKIGPPLSRVDKVTSEPAKWDGVDGFRIEKTV